MGLQLHHSQGIFQIEDILGLTLTNQEGRTIPIRTLTEEALRKSYGKIPTLSDWIRSIPMKPWMVRTAKIEHTLENTHA